MNNIIKSFEQFNKVCESTQINDITYRFKKTFAKRLHDIEIAAKRKEPFRKEITCPEWSEPDTELSFEFEFEWQPEFEVYYCTISKMRNGKVENSNIGNLNLNGFGNAATKKGYIGNAKALVRILTKILEESWYPFVMSDDELERLSHKGYDSNDSWHYSQEEF